MMHILVLTVLCVAIGLSTASCHWQAGSSPETNVGTDAIPLPPARHLGPLSVEAALQKRRSVRAYRAESLTKDEVAQILWAAQGVTDPERGYRTAPSAGALYPLEIYVTIGNVDGLPPGTYRYQPHQHALIQTMSGDARAMLSHAALDQSWMRTGAMIVTIAAVYERTTAHYGERGHRYVHMEVGHAAQNVYLQASALDLGTVIVGAFHEDEVSQILGLQGSEIPLAMMPVGKP